MKRNLMPFEDNIEGILSASENLFNVNLDEKGFYLHTNAYFKEKFWKPGSYAKNEKFFENIHPEDLAKCLETLALCIKNPGKVYSVTLRKLTY